MTIVRIIAGLVQIVLKVFVDVIVQGLAALVRILSIAGLTSLIAIAAAMGAGLIYRRHRSK